MSLPPHTITRSEHSDESGVWTKQQVRYWDEAAVKLAVREALERVILACDDGLTEDRIRRIIKEYE